MIIPDGYTDLPSHKIASVVTYLEMREAPASRPANDSRWILRRHSRPDVAWYRRLFRAVGQEWLWFSRLQMDDETLRTILHDPQIDVFSLEMDGQDKGILELDRRNIPDVEIAFIGVTPDLIGKGAGRFLLEHALDIAWSNNPSRVHLHTCTIDHPRALGFYLKAGFVAYKRAIEIADDPRLDGTLPGDAAPQFPVLR